ncbi:hypothetical protein AVEN_22449-1 [Araneus ventricosus]|uniref:Uncharacterized protein n=1 Tax=Araneus ventricosus TaxID=182803 RepID=A0A4Y2T251_ARAVE|nr:hypothetical protein AVEN_22449-1 [Araneus ventricosus]
MTRMAPEPSSLSPKFHATASAEHLTSCAPDHVESGFELGDLCPRIETLPPGNLGLQGVIGIQLERECHKPWIQK